MGNGALLTALGEENDSILFTVADTTGLHVFNMGVGSWNGIRLEKAGKYSDASTIWKKVLDYDSTYDLAYLGLGKTAYWNGDYEESMRLFELCNNKTWYSKAWEETRKEVLARWFMPIVFTIIGLLVLSFVLKIMKKNKLKKQKEATELE